MDKFDIFFIGLSIGMLLTFVVIIGLLYSGQTEWELKEDVNETEDTPSNFSTTIQIADPEYIELCSTEGLLRMYVDEETREKNPNWREDTTIQVLNLSEENCPEEAKHGNG